MTSITIATTISTMLFNHFNLWKTYYKFNNQIRMIRFKEGFIWRLITFLVRIADKEESISCPFMSDIKLTEY